VTLGAATHEHPWAKRAQIRETGRKKISRDFLPQILPEMAVHSHPAPSTEKEMEKLLSLFLQSYSRKAILPEYSESPEAGGKRESCNC